MALTFIVDNGLLQAFYTKTQRLSPKDRADAFDRHSDIAELHNRFGLEGQTVSPDPNEEESSLHFVCFVERNGVLFELDGRRDGPVAHCPTSRGTFLVVCLPSYFGRMPRVILVNVGCVSRSSGLYRTQS